MDDTRNPLGFEKKTVSTVAVALLSVPARATSCVIVCESNAVRYRDDAVDPTATDGMPIAAGQSLTYPGDPSALKFIRSGAADGTLQVLYYE